MSEQTDQVLEAPEVIWTMEAWTDQGGKLHPAEEIFETEKAVAVLLLKEVCFLNNHWWEADWPDRAKASIGLIALCNDTFDYASADGEDVPYTQIERLYRMWLRDPVWGATAWCIAARKRRPLTPIEKRMKAAGLWDIDQLIAEGLPAWNDGNTQAPTLTSIVQGEGE